jgi:hypothetical protein
MEEKFIRVRKCLSRIFPDLRNKDISLGQGRWDWSFELKSSYFICSYCITRAVSPALFVFSYFSDRVMHFLSRLALDHNPPTSAFPSGWYYRYAPPCLVYCLRDKVLLTFLGEGNGPWLASNPDSPISASCVS